MSYTTETDIELLSQNEKIINVSIQLLNSNFKVIEILDASLKSLSLSIDANSDIRRTGTLDVFPEFDGYELTQESNLWINRYARIYLNFLLLRTNTTVSYCIGTFLVDNKTFTYDVESDSLSIQLLDLMARLDGSHNGELGAESYVINMGSNIRNAMIETVKLAEIEKYIVSEVSAYQNPSSNTVPYDISFDNDITVLTILKELSGLYPAYEIFFDPYGTFCCQMIPTCQNDDNVLTEAEFDDKINIFSESRSYNYANVKNVVQVYGEAYDEAQRFIDKDNSSFSGNVLNATINNYTAYEDYDMFAIKMTKDNPANMYININNLGNVQFVQSGSLQPFEANSLIKDNVYVIHYLDGKFQYLSSFQPKGLAVLLSSPPTEQEKIKWRTQYNCNNASFVIEPENPFTVDKIGIKYTKISSEQSNYIQSDYDALASAEYYLWQYARLVNDITISCDIIPFLDVNQKITYRHLKSKQVFTYIIKKIDLQITETDARTTISASLFNDLYPDILSKESG